MMGIITHWEARQIYGFATCYGGPPPYPPEVFVHERELPSHVRASNARKGLLLSFDVLETGQAKPSAVNIAVHVLLNQGEHPDPLRGW